MTPADGGAGDPAEAVVRAALMPPLAAVTVVVGHYGSGKTNLALNLAYDAVAAGVRVTLADLDVVNPYFRSSDYRVQLEAAGIRVIAPVLAGTALDTPSVSGTLVAAIDEVDAAARRQAAELAGGALPDVEPELPPSVLIIDAGGDDVGATALGRFSERIAAAPHTVIGVANRYRNLTQEPAEAAAVLREIEGASGLSVAGIVNNSHLKADTSAETVIAAIPFGERVADELELPLLRVAAPISVVPPILAALRGSSSADKLYPVRVYMRTPWE